MIDESKVDPRVLSPRAGVALLTLQLRNTLQEAVDAEAEVASVDVDAALWQLRSRLAPLLEDRRRALAGELQLERQQAADRIAAARVAAEEIVAAATARAEEARAAQEAAELVHGDVAGPSEVEPELFDDPLDDWAGIEPVASLPQLPPPAPDAVAVVPVAPAATDDAPPDDAPTEDASADDAPADEAASVRGVTPDLPVATSVLDVVEPTSATPGSSMHVVIDAESFAKAFAAALAPVLESRNQLSAPGSYPPPAHFPAPQRKTSFWSHAWHPDVLLSGLAMVIVVIVLIAWTG